MCGKDVSGVSDMALVTPIFFRERSSVTEMERENVGREAPGGPEMDRQIFSLCFGKTSIFHALPLKQTQSEQMIKLFNLKKERTSSKKERKKGEPCLSFPCIKYT